MMSSATPAKAAPDKTTARKLIFVTGSPRSGTTWVGRVLGSVPNTNFLLEPFNLERSQYFSLPLTEWYQRLTEDDLARFRPIFADLVDGRRTAGLDPVEGWKRLNPLAHMYLAARKVKAKRKAIHADTVILKDPIAICSADWFYHHFNSHNIVMIRHPAGVASSIRLHQWHFEYEQLLDIDVADEFFPGERERIAGFRRGDDELLFRACILWRLMHRVIRAYQQDYPDWIYLKHEDVAPRPREAFRELFEKLDLPFGAKTEAFLEQTTKAPTANDALQITTTDDVARESQATVDVWKHRLSNPERKLVRELTEDIAADFYSSEDW